MSFKQADRLPDDGAMGVQRLDNGNLLLSVETAGKEQSMEVSDYNAARLFGSIAFFLGLPLPSKISKEIKM